MPDTDKQAPKVMTSRETDFLYDSLAEILSANRPIEGSEEAFNCASTLNDVLHFLAKVVGNIELSDRDRSAISEILGALELVAKRVMEWERRAVGIDTLDSAEMKFMEGRSDKRK